MVKELLKFYFKILIKVIIEITRSSAVRHDIIQREEKYRQLVGRHTAISYAEGVNVSAGWRVVQHSHWSTFYRTENF